MGQTCDVDRRREGTKENATHKKQRKEDQEENPESDEQIKLRMQE